MTCATRLVEIFGSQAEVARALRLDRAVVSNWVKSGYVPARWATEVERVTNGGILAVEVLNEASAKKPVKVKSRPDDVLFGSPLSGRKPWTISRPPNASAHSIRRREPSWVLGRRKSIPGC